MPTGSLPPANAALNSILQGLSATAGLSWYRSLGGRISNQIWYQLRGELEASLAAREGIYDEPQHLRPTQESIRQWTTSKARGYIQQVEVLVHERDTGQVVSVPYSSMGRTLRSRAAIVREALDIYSGSNAEKYGQRVLGAIYTGTYQAVPLER